MKAYLASPLGFSAATALYMQQVYAPAIATTGIKPVNPWDLTSSSEIEAVLSLPMGEERNAKIHELHLSIGERNRAAIDQCEMVIAHLDGQELDSGTAAELGYAAGKDKLVLALRTDYRQCGEVGAQVNLQVAYFVESSGGQIFHTLDELCAFLRSMALTERVLSASHPEWSPDTTRFRRSLSPQFARHKVQAGSPSRAVTSN